MSSSSSFVRSETVKTSRYAIARCRVEVINDDFGLMLFDQPEERGICECVGRRHEDLGEQRVEILTVGHQLRAINTLESLWQKDVTGAPTNSKRSVMIRSAPSAPSTSRCVSAEMTMRSGCRSRMASRATCSATMPAHRRMRSVSRSQTRSSSPVGRPHRSVMRWCVSQRSQSSAAMHPVPAAVIACR